MTLTILPATWTETTMTIDLDPDAYEVARREARTAGIDVQDWIASVVFRCSTGDIPFDDGGFPTALPQDEETLAMVG